MSKPGYVIVKAPHIDKLPGYVNDAIQNGYRPTGGPVRLNGARGEYGADEWWGQAMVLEGCKP